MDQRRAAARIVSLLFCIILAVSILPITALAAEGEAIAFSAEEQAVIDASVESPVTVGVITTSAPECYLDPDTGEFVGVTMELLNAISEKTGLRFAYMPIDLANNAPVGWLKAGAFDLVAGILKMQTFVDDPTLVLSDTLFADSIVMIGRLGDDFTRDPENKVIAVSGGFQAGREYVANQFPAHTLLMCENLEACMKAVQSGRADATVYLRVCSSYLFQNPRFEGLQVVPAYSRDITTCLAGLSKKSATLMRVVNKGLSMISETERTTIIMEYTILNPYRMSFQDILYKNRVSISIVTALVLLILAACIFILSLRRKSAKRVEEAYEQAKAALKQAEEARSAAEAANEMLRHQIRLTQQWQEASETDSLTGLLNRRGGEQRIQGLLDHGAKGLFCLFDIDKFKQINDTYGHEVGDEALKAVARCMRAFRDSDVQIRYGGDEFAVYAVGISTREQAEECVERFQDAIGKIAVPGMGEKTLSVSLGMLLYAGESEMDFTELCRRADIAMYQCKNSEQGRYRYG